LTEYVPQIIVVAIAYHIIYLMASLFTPLLPGFSGLSLKRKTDFNIRIVSQVQCAVILYVIVPLFYDQSLAEDTIFATSDYSYFAASCAAGYFLWDSLICMVYYNMFGFPFLMHGLISLTVFTFGFYPALHYWIPRFLLFECSTPFVNIHWYSTHIDWPLIFTPTFTKVNGIILIVVFFFCRIVFGWYYAINLYIDVFAARDRIPWFIMCFLVAGNTFLNSLNVIWFTKMIRLAKRSFSKS
ncbi:hypothetical protein CANCADRAFT_15610, partial [Tortispora caseinolytica NRRL Y-17796]